MPDPRGRILNEAAELFARDGYEGASLGSLAEAVGVTKAAIYHYFPNKMEIYEAIIVQTLRGLLAHGERHVAEITDASTALRRFMTAHADYFEQNYHGFITMLVGYGGMENKKLIAEAKDLRRAYERLLRGIVSRGIATGQFRDVDIHTTSRAVLSMLNWMARWFEPGKKRPARAFAGEYCDLILGGLAAPARKGTR